MILELYINNQLVDIDENTEISLAKEFQSDEDLERKQVEYSYELELPITFTNQKVFGFANDMQVKHKFYQQYSAQLYAEHILVIDGNFMLTEVSKDSFIGNIYVPSYKELKDVLGDKKMYEIEKHDISLQTYDSINYMNYAILAGGELVIKNEYIGDIVYKNDYVCFPYIVYNFPRSNFTEKEWDIDHEKYQNVELESNNYVQLQDYANTTYSMNNIYPSFNVLKVIEKMFNTYGLKVSGNVFNDKRFTDLWMTSSFEAQKYTDNINIPQYVSVYGTYYGSGGLLAPKKSTTYSFHEKTQNDERENYKYWSDDLFHSDGTSIWLTSNPHEMWHETDDGSNGSIVINKSGWYLVNFNTQTQFNYGVGNSSFSTSQVEIRLVKGEARNSVEWYSQFGQAPIAPRYDDTVNEGEGYLSVGTQAYKVRGWSNADVKGYVRIPQNGGVATVHSYSNFDTDRFICGARFGQAANQNRRGYYEYNYDNDDWNMMMLPWVEHINDLVWDEDKENWILPLTNGKYQGEQPTIHTYDTAVVLMSENVYSYNGGYIEPEVAEGEYTKNGHQYKTCNWHVGKGFSNPSKIKQSKAYYSGDILPSATCDESCVVWLSEGETINAEILVSKDYMHEKTYPSTTVTWNVTAALLSTDKNWKPEGNNIIPENIASLYVKDATNINQFLPDMTCNDFIETFLNTFNLRITKISSDEYSINFSDIRKTTLNIVPLDKYLDLSKVSQSAIELPSEYNFKFTTSNDEEGYVHGDDSMFNISEKKVNEKPNYDGHKTIENFNNNSGESVDIESKFSYNWYKTIWTTKKDKYKEWLNDGKPAYSKNWKYGGYIDKFPVIADAENWNKSFAEGSTQGDKTSTSPRMFYIEKSRIEYIYDSEGKIKIALLKPINNIDGFDLDFNSVPSFVGIEDSLFSTIIEPSYEVRVQLAMSNEDYQKIQKNTLVKINDELYRVVKIDGHSVTGEAEGDLVLKAII